jgi:dTDP-4-dehydrorhamnose reductase
MVNKILVLGSQGMLGSSLVPYLQSRGYYVLTQGRKPGTDVCFDLTEKKRVISSLNEIGADVIINLAALTNVDECERNPHLAYLSNVNIIENLIEGIKNSQTDTHFIQISTDQVYDGLGPHTEQDVKLMNYYSFSKYAGELAASYIPSTILRTNFFGISQCSGRKSFSDWIVQSLINGEKITVFSDIFFSPLSFYTLIHMIELVINKKISGTYNLGSRGCINKADFAFTLADVLQISKDNLHIGSSAHANLAAYRPQNMCMDSSLFEKTFEINLPTIREEIESMKVDYSHVSD